MKIGDYVRNKYGIAKIINISNNDGIDIIEFDREIAFLVNKETKKEHRRTRFLPLTNNVDINKLKTSPKIIDLIEVGDYINEFPVIHKTQNEIVCGILLTFKEKDIKSIVTKEQFSSMRYEVEQDE